MKLPTYQQLTKEQDKINNLPLDGTWLVTGPPGTGKTVMALYRSKMITDRRQKAVLLMYGRLLSQYTTQAVEELEIEGVVHPFVSWWASFCRKRWGEYPRVAPYVADWPAIVELFREQGLEEDILPYLLVDEGQDLPKSFFVFASRLATRLTVFADENQRLHKLNSTLEDIRNAIEPDGEYALKKNYRNSRRIAEVAAAFYPGGPTGVPDLPGGSGLAVQLRQFADVPAAAVQIANLATTDAQEHIGVLVPRVEDVDAYVEALQALDVNVQWYTSKSTGPGPEVDFTVPGVVVTTWVSAKGLEFETVFVAELQSHWHRLDDPALRMQLYVLASRARDRLTFTYTGPGTPGVISLLPSSVERVP